MRKIKKPERLRVLNILLIMLAFFLQQHAVPARSAAWSQFQKDAVNSGRTSSAAPVSSPRVAWSAFTSYRATHGIDVTPVAAAGRVFVIDVDGWAWAFDAAAGNVLWQSELEGDTRFKLATPAWGEGKVFFATDKGYMYALNDATGEIIWGGRLTAGIGQNAELNTQLVYAEGKIYAGSWEGKYYCLNAAGDGSSPAVEWVYQQEGKRYDWYSGAAVMGNYVVFGNTDGELVSVHKDSGIQADILNLGESYGVSAGSIRSAVSANPAQDMLYLTSRNGYVYAVGFNRGTGRFDGERGWARGIDRYSTSTPVYHQGRLYVCSGGSFINQEGGLYCFDAAAGALLWFNDLGVVYGSQASPALSIQNGAPYIYITTSAPHGAAACFDRDGNLLWQYLPDHSEYILQGVALYDGRVYFGNDAGYLYALESVPPGDVNGDGLIDFLDLIRIGNRCGEGGAPGWIAEDVNRDGRVDHQDLVMAGNRFA